MTPTVSPAPQVAMTDLEIRHMTRISIPSDLAEVRRVQDEIESALQANQFSEKELFAVRLALEEALVNAAKHGNQLDRSKFVHIAYTVTPERFDISVADEGPGFNPEDVPDPTDIENLERPCGRGLFLMRAYMTEVNYNARGNAVTLAKVRQPS